MYIDYRVDRFTPSSIHTNIDLKKNLKTPFPLVGRSGIYPSGVGLQVDLPYGRSILQVDHPKEQAFEQKQVSEMSPCQS